MTDDDQSLGDKLKGGFGTVGRLAVFTGLVGAATIKKIKDTIVGDPPSPWRKGLVFGSAALALGYTACEDEIDTAGQRTYTYLNGRQAQRVEHLEEELAETRQRNDSLSAKTKELTTDLSDLTSAYENTLDSLTRQEQALQRRLDSMTATYQAGERRRDDTLSRTTPYADTVIVQNNTEITLDGVTASPETTQSERDKREKTTKQGCWHPVQDGETLSEISLEYTGRIKGYESLAASNNIDDPDRVPIGFPVRLDVDPCPASTTQPPAYTVIHRDEDDLEDDLARIDGDPDTILAYNRRRGNHLRDSDSGDDIAVYLP